MRRWIRKNRDLREELTYVATDAYIEETARNDFGYVRDGEIHFHFASMDVLRGLHRGGMERAAG